MDQDLCREGTPTRENKHSFPRPRSFPPQQKWYFQMKDAKNGPSLEKAWEYYEVRPSRIPRESLTPPPPDGHPPQASFGRRDGIQAGGTRRRGRHGALQPLLDYGGGSQRFWRGSRDIFRYPQGHGVRVVSSCASQWVRAFSSSTQAPHLFRFYS